VGFRSCWVCYRLYVRIRGVLRTFRGGVLSGFWLCCKFVYRHLSSRYGTNPITQIDHLWYQWTPHTASIVVEPEIRSDWYRFCLSGPNHPEACSGESVPLDNHGHAPNIWDNCPSSWLKVCATPPTRRNPSPPVTIFSRTYHLILLAHSNRQCLIRSVSVSRLGRIWTKLIPLTGYLSSKPNIVAKFFSDAEAFLTGFI